MAQKRPVVADLDFTTVKEDMISYFKSKDEFKDFEFTGSGMNLLMDILAYNTHYNAMTANFMLNEMFLDSAVVRSNVVSLAKSLNYVPRSARSASIFVTLTVTKSGTETFAVIPSGTLFTATVASTSQRLNFYTVKPYTVQFETTETSANVTVQAFEGKITTQRFIHTSAKSGFSFFDLQNQNIDTTTLNVSVNGVKWTQVTPETEGITEITDSSFSYFIEETRTGSHRLVFGDGKIGSKLNTGDEIIATYLISSGANGNGATTVSLASGAFTNVSISSNTVSSGGDAPETIREIRTNAPHWFQSQYRAVTENDYSVFLKKKYADIQAINVYGGETVGNPGKVYIVIKPKSTDVLPAATKAAIVADVIGDSKVVTITPVIVDPQYLNIVLKTTIIYDETTLVTSSDYLETSVIAMLSNFNTEYIGDFMQTFRASQLSAEIDNIDESIVSSNTRVSLRIDIASKSQKLDRYSFSFANKIFHPEDGYKASTGGVLSTNLFYRVGKNYQSGFDDDGYGNIRLFDQIGGVKQYVNDHAGSIDYETGDCGILIDVDPEDTTIKFSVTPDSFDVISEKNTILRIAVDDSKVIAIEKNNLTSQKLINLNRSV